MYPMLTYSCLEDHKHCQPTEESALKKCIKLCDAKHPEVLTSSILQNHIAMISEFLNFEENECDQLANVLGHDVHIHRRYYRLPRGTLQLARMNKVLLAMETGTVSWCKGMTLDEIKVDCYGHLTRAPASVAGNTKKIPKNKLLFFTG